MQVFAAAQMLKVDYLRSRVTAVAGIILPALLPADPLAALYYLNMSRIRSSMMQQDHFIVVPVLLPADGIIPNFDAFVAVPNLIVLKIVAISVASLTVQFMGTSDRNLANVVPIVAIIGHINSTLTIPRPAFYLRVAGDFLDSLALPVVLAQQPNVPIPAGIAPGIPAPPPLAVAPLLRISEEEDFKDISRVRGLFSTLLLYTTLYFLTGEGVAPTGKHISWTGASDAVTAALSNNNRLASPMTTVSLSKTEMKQYLLKDFRMGSLSITAFAVHGSGHESIFNALENLAILEGLLTGSELRDAILHLRHGARTYYHDHPRMPLDLVAESINAHLHLLRTTGEAKHLRRLRKSEFPNVDWSPDPAVSLPGDSPFQLAVVVAHHAQDRRKADDSHLGAGSRVTYATGWRAWCWYCVTWNLPTNIFLLSVATVQLAVEYFMFFLRNRRGIKMKTITQYVSHVCDQLITRRYPIANNIRSPHSRSALQSFLRDDLLGKPYRLTCKIPIGASLVLKVLDDIRTTSATTPAFAMQLATAIVLAFGVCLRSGESVSHGRHGLPDHAIRCALVAFQWDNDINIYPVTAPQNFPSHLGTPCRVIVMQDTQKNHAEGTGPRGIERNPRPDASTTFCVPTMVYQYVLSHPQTDPNAHFFPDVHPAHITTVIQRVGTAAGLDEQRLCAHGLRAGSLSAIMAGSPPTNSEQLIQHGLWHSAQGLQPYAHRGIRHGADVALLLYDTEYPSIDFLCWYYCTPYAGHTVL